MKKKSGFRFMIMSAFLAACGASGAVLAEGEVESNDTLANAQRLSIGPGGSASVKGVIGVVTGTAISDVDFYSFRARAGDVLTIDIDQGYLMGERSVNTFLTVLGPSKTSDYLYEVLTQNDNSRLWPLDDGSDSNRDPYIKNFTASKDGVYYVAVTGVPRTVANGGLVVEGTSSSQILNGDYILNVEGVTAAVQHINIEIKPGSGVAAPVNPKARGSIPVALLSSIVSSNEFDPLTVKRSSLTFGSTGDEQSWKRCSEDPIDLNGDGKLDLVCHFDNQAAKFNASDLEGILKGETEGGTQFEGSGLLKVLPQFGKKD